MQYPPNGSFVLLTTKEEIIEINIQLLKSAQEAWVFSFKWLFKEQPNMCTLSIYKRHSSEVCVSRSFQKVPDKNDQTPDWVLSFFPLMSWNVVKFPN